MKDDDRQPGESLADYNYRVGQAQKAAREKIEKADRERYEPATNAILADLAAEVKAMLEDLIGPTSLSVAHQVQARSERSIGPQRATATAHLQSRAKNAPLEVSVMIIVTSLMQGSALPEEMAYSLLGTYSCRSGADNPPARDLPLNQSNPERPTIAANFGQDIKRAAHLG